MVDRGGAFSTEFATRKKWKVDQGLFNAILATIPSKSSIVDLGAGKGHYVAALRDAGYMAIGIDGIPEIDELSGTLVVQARLDELIRFEHPADWGISIEVGEHIPQESASRYFDNLAICARDGLIVSWAVPGQRGRNHINCRLPEYVAVEMRWRGWVLAHGQTVEARRVAGKGWDKKLLVFRSEPNETTT